MNTKAIDRLVEAVLYEGYTLYPDCPLPKNHKPRPSGCLYPPDYAQSQNGGASAGNQTECLVAGSAQVDLTVTVRFLHLIHRQVGNMSPPTADWRESRTREYEPVADRGAFPVREAEERSVGINAALHEMVDKPYRARFQFNGRRWLEPLHDENGLVAGVLLRAQQTIRGLVCVHAAILMDGLYRLTIQVENQTPFESGGQADPETALQSALVSTHTVIQIRGGELLSLLDPPAYARGAADECSNKGTWPVLFGEPGGCDTVLSSPIILHDYPPLPPEGQGSWLDPAEIDEILTRRINALTDEEKRLGAALDLRLVLNRPR